MHSHFLEASDEIDYNLYPALLQVFTIILIGYLAGCFEIMSKSQMLGLNRFVGTFALPALLFRSIAVLDFSSVDWLFLASIFLSKTIVFLLAIALTLITLRPINIGLAAAFAIFVSQSNDFALGYPIVDAIYSQSHPDYLHYIYLIAPISLCILNPIAFLMMEANETLYRNREIKALAGQSDAESETGSLNEKLLNKNDREIEENEFLTATTSTDTSGSGVNPDLIDEIESPVFTNQATPMTTMPKKISSLQLLKTTIWSTISNPIVFMTLIGIIANFILKQHIPKLIDPILLTLSNSFSALALFYLGCTMVGKIRNLKFTSIVIILILIFTKSLIFPLVNREIILHLSSTVSNATQNETESLSTFGFLYGTFPTAPSLFFYIARYKAFDDALISSALVFGTLVSAPLMMISGKMISFKYNSSTVSNFEDIECKTAYGFSILSWLCCLWLLYIFSVSGRGFRKSHVYTLLLVLSQMCISIVHIVWSNMTTNVNDLEPIYGYLHVLSGLYFAYASRCIPLSMLFNIISITGIKHMRTKTFRILIKLSNSRLFLIFIGLGLPAIATGTCALVGNIPVKQSMMLSISKGQIIISNVLLFFVVAALLYFMIVFVRTKNDPHSLAKFLSNQGANEDRKRGRNLAEADADNSNNTSERLMINSGNVHNRNVEAVNYQDEDSEGVGDSQQWLISNNRVSLNYVYLFDEEIEKNAFQNDYQIAQQISLIVILGFTSLMCFFFQMWVLFDETKSGIFYELELIDITLLYGQGFFTFLIFGLDNDYIFAPILFKIKEVLHLVEPFKPMPIEEVPNGTIEICKKFEEKYKTRCKEDIVRNQRFHHKYYLNVFKGNEFVSWLVGHKLVKNRKQGEELGKKLIDGGVILHVSNKRHFYDSFNLYKFNAL